MTKNEAHVIARLLASMRPLVDTWLLMDTGSTDATCEIARAAMEGLPGEVVHRPWRHFGESRTEAFELARGRADYVLIADADDVFQYPQGARFPSLTASAYYLMNHAGGLRFPRLHLFRSSVPWRFVGRCHEHPSCDVASTPELLEGIAYLRVGGGARDSNPAKYLVDAALLEEDLAKDPTHPRNVFLLARSYDHAGALPRALANYERRVLLGGWEEEVFYAALSAARIRERLGEPYPALERAYLEAWRRRPHRAEPLYELARAARIAGNLRSAQAHAAQAAEIPYPWRDQLFIDSEVYAWRALDELAGITFLLGGWARALRLNQELLASGRAPEAERARIEANVELCSAAVRRDG
jgi:hypothetical protein